MPLKHIRSSVTIAVVAVSGILMRAQAQEASTPIAEKPFFLGESTITGEYKIADITVSGAQYADAKIITDVSGLQKNQHVKLPNDAGIARAVRVLWNQGMFSEVSISITKTVADKIYLNINVKERPRLTEFKFTGINNSQATELKEKIGLVQNKMLTEALRKDIEIRTQSYFGAKGFQNTVVTITETKDPKIVNGAILTVHVDRGNKVKINNINIAGNEALNDMRIKRSMKGTKEMARLSLYPADRFTVYPKPERSFGNYVNSGGLLSPSKTLAALDPYFRYKIMSASKFEDKKYEEDKSSVINLYNTEGYRDAQIVQDTIYKIADGNLNVELKLDEGQKYYFGDLHWKGNTKHSDSTLSALLGIKRGDVYNKELLTSRLSGRATMEGGVDVGSVYLDNGYLTYRGEAVERAIRKDTIDFDILINEGPQFTVKNINILGNDRTNDYVLRREFDIYPGEKYVQSSLISSIRKISNLGYIDATKVNPVPRPNMQDKTVDIDFNIAEKSSDQLELSAGFGNGIGFTGTAGIVFNNFSLKNLFKFKSWDPLPMGDGQKLSLRYQSNGKFYNSFSFSFTEPWLGGRKPISLTLSLNSGRYAQVPRGMEYRTATGREQFISNFGGGIMISRRLNWPDNNFIISTGIEYMRYRIKDYPLLQAEIPEYRNGTSNNLALKLTLARTTVDQPIFPRSGSNISLSLSLTPPVSLFSDKNYSTLTARERFKWVEYHKYKFNAEWYQRVVGNLVLKLSTKYGFLGYYNKNLGFSPFERFQVGGDGMSGFNYFVGKDIVAHRGFDVYGDNFTIFNKYTAELRYPFSLNPSATIFGLAFFEASNGYNNIKEYNPFKLYRSVGVGVRVFLPMFGLLGLDYGIGIDNLRNADGSMRKLGAEAKFTFMLGQEPQ